ncbi:hypothetical protein BJF96_g2179 [Verticillium dahliae]|uniref:Uncharacterized protein n=1 Tax=Verticillium dahliae TaxID=27337 RepID=A0AA45AP04_VERDA|nr:hypothetical protein BJF96_g2179 [Verticillium dahliae]
MPAATWSDLPNELRWVIFNLALARLLKLLAPWSTSPERRGGLALDLAVYSPSDAKQTSNELSLTAHYAFTAGITLPMKHVRAPRPVRRRRVPGQMQHPRQQTQHCGRHGRRPRTFATVCGPGCPTLFKIIRSHRPVGSASIARLISTCLANLDALHSQRWHCRNASSGDQLYGESLKRLYLFSEAEAETQ